MDRQQQQEWENLKALQTMAFLLEELHPKQYPFGHPKYRPPKDAILPYIDVDDSKLGKVTLKFDTEDEAEEFYYVFKGLSRNAKDRAIAHMQELEKDK